MAKQRKAPSKTMSKPKTAPKKEASPKAAQPSADGANVSKKDSAVVKKKTTGPATDRGGRPLFLKKTAFEFTVGTKEYAEVVEAYNKTHGTGWSKHRVPPYIFKNMLVHLNRYYDAKGIK